ncbi:MAG: 3-mercaptopyruvate sulfurtransferase [Acidobacteria bacterium]|nr:3-mercaptopyruvate sulfurtransferase [Acidobacteriota bacterium]
MSILVEHAWLAEHLADTNLVVLDATLPPTGVTPPLDTHARYLAQHIPGTIFFNIDDISDHASPYPHMLPSPEEFAQKMSALGVSDTATIVVYEQQGVFSASRAWWMLKTMGAQNVHLLNGDLAAWRAAGLPLETGEVHRAPTTFHANFNASAVVSYEELQSKLAAQQQILDARSAGRFAGTAPEPRPGLRSGHMPGATSTPFTDLVDQGKLKSQDALRAYFSGKGVDLEKPITTTCGSGVTAAVIALGLELSGAHDVALYDGSWAEYAQRSET